MRDSLLVLPVGGGEYLGDRLLVKNEIEEREERLVGIRGRVVVLDVENYQRYRVGVFGLLRLTTRVRGI